MGPHRTYSTDLAPAIRAGAFHWEGLDRPNWLCKIADLPKPPPCSTLKKAKDGVASAALFIPTATITRAATTY